MLGLALIPADAATMALPVPFAQAETSTDLHVPSD